VEDILVLRDGSEVPDGWPVFRSGEVIILRKYRWKVSKMDGSDLTLTGIGPLGDVKPLSKTDRNRAKRRRKKQDR
jgi:hypothetical protein